MDEREDIPVVGWSQGAPERFNKVAFVSSKIATPITASRDISSTCVRSSGERHVISFSRRWKT